MSPILDNWNSLDTDRAIAQLSHCCASSRWAERVAAARPLATPDSLFKTADEVWAAMEEADFLQAFEAHPKIGGQQVSHASLQSSQWSHQEQASVQNATENVLGRLADLNRLYETKFGFTYIVCATGKSTAEMLSILEQRLKSDRRSELLAAAEQQRQITQLRLRKWLES